MADTVPTKIFKNCQWIQKFPSVNKKKSANFPCKRWGHTAVIHDKYMYVFSGCGKSESPRQWEQIYKMDCLTFQWERLTSLSAQHPQSRDSHSCVQVQNKLYYYAGSCNDTILGDMWSYDLATNEWAEIPVVPELTAREGHSMTVLSNRIIYIYGGWDSSKNMMQDTHWLFDVETLKFLQVTKFTGDELTKLESHSANLIGDSVYIFGGQGQSTGKTGVFYKDLFRVDFENITSIEEKFTQMAIELKDDESKDSAIQIQPQETSIHIEKIKQNGPIQPSPRASHTAVTYADRFLFVIGGEGYQTDQGRDNEIIEQHSQDGASNEQEEAEDKPIFPKNDIWIFETVMKTWSKLVPKQKTPVFQPRFSHSCVVFKDQLILFGGLRSMGEVLEDIIVLHLKDSENHLQKFQRDEIKNVCRYCQLIYGIQLEEDLQFSRTVEVNAIQQPKVSLSFINGITSLIHWPFSCFGLLLDNARMSEAKDVRIELIQQQRRKVYENSVDEQTEKLPLIIFQQNDTFTFTSEEFQELLFNFEVPQLKVCLHKQDREAIIKNGASAAQLLYQDELRASKKIYGINLKMACLRLAQSALICARSGSTYYVGLISTNTQINHNLESIIIHHYTLEKEKDKEKRVDQPEDRYVIRNYISHLISEEEYILSTPQNYIKVIMFDLNKAPHQRDQPLYELYGTQDDVMNQHHLSWKLKQDKASQYPDFSLKMYLQLYCFESLPFKLYLQNQQIPMVNDVVSKLKNSALIDIPNEESSTRLRECTNDKFRITQRNNDSIGILLYSQGRLINRYPTQFGQLTKPFQYNGYLNLIDFMTPNIAFDGFQNCFLQCTLYSTLSQVMDQQEDVDPGSRKEIKII